MSICSVSFEGGEGVESGEGAYCIAPYRVARLFCSHGANCMQKVAESPPISVTHL